MELPVPGPVRALVAAALAVSAALAPADVAALTGPTPVSAEGEPRADQEETPAD